MLSRALIIELFLTHHSVSFTNKCCPVLAGNDATFDTKKVHLDNLYRMVSYCENLIDCRRSQQLEYFGEVFDRQYCRENPRALCDSCTSSVSKTVLWLHVIHTIHRPGKDPVVWFSKRYFFNVHVSFIDLIHTDIDPRFYYMYVNL